METFFLIAIVILVFIVVFQISKASEYVSILKGEEKARKQDNKINGFLMMVFLVLGLIGVWWCNDALYHKTLFSYGSASTQGKSIDDMMWITIIIKIQICIILPAIKNPMRCFCCLKKHKPVRMVKSLPSFFLYKNAIRNWSNGTVAGWAPRA